MKKTRNLLCVFLLAAAVFGPGAAAAEEEPTTSSTDTAPLTLDADQIQALQDAADGTSSGDKSTFEKVSDFVTDNAPWFIIGIIVLAAIVAGILIMRGRDRGYKAPKASRSDKRKRKRGGAPRVPGPDQPAQVPSAAELRRRKRAAIQRSREEERLRRKQGIESRKAARRGQVPAPVAMAPTGAAAPAAGLDPVEAEKQAARDQATAAGAMARFGGGAVPAPVSPSQTAPAPGIVTPQSAQPGAYEAPVEAAPEQAQPAYEPEPEQYYQPDPEVTQVGTPAPSPAPEAAAPPAHAPEAETSVIHEPAIESPGPDATVGKAAQAFLAGGAGGLAAARGASESREPEPEGENLDPVIAPEPGMAPEHALGVEPDPAPQGPATPAETPLAPSAPDERVRATAAELRATQEPAGRPEPAADVSPGLAAVERKLSENSEERDRALREAEERLRRVEQRAEEAERRAAFAERLAQLKVEESERERRLNEVVSGIDRAEQRAREAEARARAAEEAAAAALEKSDLNLPAPAPSEAPPAPEVKTADADPEPSGSNGEDEPVAAAPERKGLFGATPASPAAPSDAINLNSATFEELREAGLSVTQATRILAYRERFGGYNAVDDLEKVPGFPPDLIESLRNRVTI